MAVLNQWQRYSDDASFRAVVDADPSFGQMSEEFFAFNPLRSVYERGM